MPDVALRAGVCGIAGGAISGGAERLGGAVSAGIKATCEAKRCARAVDPHTGMYCLEHWAMLPVDLRIKLITNRRDVNMLRGAFLLKADAEFYFRKARQEAS